MLRRSVLVAASLLPLLGAGENPSSGTWNLNVSKSKFSPGPAPKSAKLVVDEQGERVKVAYEEVESDDSRAGFEYTASMDGKDYPIAGAPLPEALRGVETVLLRKNGARAYGALFKKTGQVIATSMTSVSKDGKTLTLAINGADAKGQPITLSMFWDKQ